MNKSQIYKIEHDMLCAYSVYDCENDDDYKIMCASMSAINEMASAILREIKDEGEGNE